MQAGTGTGTGTGARPRVKFGREKMDVMILYVYTYELEEVAKVGTKCMDDDAWRVHPCIMHAVSRTPHVQCFALG